MTYPNSIDDSDSKKNVLFICRNNSGRSQMAEALLEYIYSDHYQVYSAGSDPKPINLLSIKVMEELNIDMSTKYSKSLKEFEGYEFDLVVSLCGEEDEQCPVFLTGKRYIHHGFSDPRSFTGTSEEKLELFRKVRDEIQEWIIREF
ncbi:MAG TPA: arsenate reductase ArsC [Methanobacteriaceae archaeon]|nr:arsenate reductase ArsC [Methanobacteriaceae archaeon]